MNVDSRLTKLETRAVGGFCRCPEGPDLATIVRPDGMSKSPPPGCCDRCKKPVENYDKLEIEVIIPEVI